MKSHSRPSSHPAGLVAGWVIIMSFGIMTVVAEPLLGQRLAPDARQGLGLLLAGNILRPEIATLFIYAGILFAGPLLLLGAAAAVDGWLSRGRGRCHPREFAWVVQFLFLMTLNACYVLIARLNIRPDPLIQLHRDPGSWAYWTKLTALFFAGLILSDIIIYWIHRAQHRFAWLWRFHAIHHSQTVDALHNINHPIEMLANYLLATIPVAMLVRVNAVELLLLSAFFMVQGYLNHMRAPLHLGPLGAILVDNRFHHIHHSRDPTDFNTNFAARFTFIDRLFGTYRARRDVLPETGLSDRAPPRTIAQYFLASWPEEAAKPELRREHLATEG